MEYTKKEKMKIVMMLKQFMSKAICIYCDRAAGKYLNDLSEYITNEEHSQLMTAWIHRKNGEGHNEVCSLCKNLVKKYRPKKL